MATNFEQCRSRYNKRCKPAYNIKLSCVIVLILNICTGQVDAVALGQQSKSQIELKQNQALTLNSMSDQKQMLSSTVAQKTDQQQQMKDLNILIDMQDGMKMMSQAFLNKKKQGEIESSKSKATLELAQTKSESQTGSKDSKLESIGEDVLNLKRGLKNIFETKFVIGGVVWTVWDWTIFVFILGFIVVGSLIAFLICWCCYPNRYEEEEDAVKDQDNMTLDQSLKEQREAQARLSASFAAAGVATMDVGQRDIYKDKEADMMMD